MIHQHIDARLIIAVTIGGIAILRAVHSAGRKRCVPVVSRESNNRDPEWTRMDARALGCRPATRRFRRFNGLSHQYRRNPGVLVRLGQGGSRISAGDAARVASSAVPIGDRTPDRYWKLGVFYFNPDDSAVLVEKRFGLGYNLNFARPTAWIILSLSLMAPLIPVLAYFTHR
jgi:Family of unknown function (DUF5808)